MLDASNVRVAVTGAIYADLTRGNAPAPTGTGSALDPGFADLGYANSDGVTLTFPGAGEATAIKAWQNGATVRTLTTPSEDNPTIQFIILETKLEVIEFTFGVTVTQSETEGHYDIDTAAAKPVPAPVVLDVIDGAELIRVHAPEPTISEIEDITLKNDGDDSAIGYGVTLDCARNAAAGYNLRTWMTALRLPAAA